MDMRLQSLTSQENPPTSPVKGSLHQCGNGYLWRLDGFTQHRRQALNNEVIVVNSPSFYTGTIGYKMRLRLYANGEGQYRSKSMSVFAQIQKGDFDGFLPWPFQGKVSVMLIDQRDFKNHVTDAFHSSSQRESCLRPSIQSSNNPNFGSPNFLSLDRLGPNMATYAQDDTLFIKVEVEVGPGLEERLEKLSIHKAVALGIARR